MGKGPCSHSYGSLGFAKISCPVGSYDNYVNRGSPHPAREKKIPWFIASVHFHGANTPAVANWCEDTISWSNQGKTSSRTPLHANLLHNHCFQNRARNEEEIQKWIPWGTRDPNHTTESNQNITRWETALEAIQQAAHWQSEARGRTSIWVISGGFIITDLRVGKQGSNTLWKDLSKSHNSYLFVKWLSWIK